MEDSTNKITFWAEKSLTREEIKACSSLVNQANGISKVVYADRSVSLQPLLSQISFQ